MFIKSLIATAIFGLVATTSWASSLPKIGDATLKLYNGSGRAYCSSIVVGKKFLITANHCVDKDMNIRFDQYDKELNIVGFDLYYVKPVRTLRDKDVALLEVIKEDFDFNQKKVQPVDVSSNSEANSIKFGDDVFAIGYPAVQALTVTEGLFGQSIKSPDQNLWKGLVYRFTAPIIGGNSGGGLYAKFKNEYKLIGLTVGGYNTNGAFMNIATPIESIEAVLKDFTLQKTLETIKNESSSSSTRIDSR